jgi:hypothetical protein
LKLDKTYFKAYHFNSQEKEIANYKNLEWKEIMKIFNYLNSVAFNYPLGKPPKMDKTVFHTR